MTLLLTGAGWCAVYLGSLFGVMASIAGEHQLAATYLLCALSGWAAVRATEISEAS
jgi:hypothetical protein